MDAREFRTACSAFATEQVASQSDPISSAWACSAISKTLPDHGLRTEADIVRALAPVIANGLLPLSAAQAGVLVHRLHGSAL
ncbi:MAG: hypothetical protein IPN66_09400 [Candidatus Competibacteraceae bacterium]|nr:hypothetical protein [Candidatus Competibacteraceae bacterium]